MLRLRNGAFRVSLNGGRTNGISLLPQAQCSAIDITVCDLADSDYICVAWKSIEKKPAFALDSGVFIARRHRHILTRIKLGQSASLGGATAATVRCAEEEGLPINVQVVAARWRDLTALSICRAIEQEFGGWKAPDFLSS